MKKIALIMCNDMHMDIERANQLLTMIEISRGYELASDYADADCIVVLTCAYGNKNKRRTIRILANVEQKAKEEAEVIITGCLVKTSGKELKKLFPKWAIVNIGVVKNMLVGNTNKIPVKKFIPSNTIVISEGCQKGCSYCVYSQIARTYNSKPIETIYAEIAEMYGSEDTICITGSHETSDYGVDIDGQSSFAKLLNDICIKYPNCNYVIGWLHPDGLTESVMDVVIKHRNIKEIMVHIQHTSDRILTMSNRPSFEETDLKIRHLKRFRPDLVISTQVITGLPGETEEEFNQLCEYLEQSLFTDIGVSSYEEVKGTSMAKFSNQVPVKERVRRMNEIVQRYSATPYKGERARPLKQYYQEVKRILE